MALDHSYIYKIFDNGLLTENKNTRVCCTFSLLKNLIDKSDL